MTLQEKAEENFTKNYYFDSFIREYTKIYGIAGYFAINLLNMPSVQAPVIK